MTAVELDTLAPQTVIDRLKGLAVAGNPWFGSAGEMVALSYLKQGKPQHGGRNLRRHGQGQDAPRHIAIPRHPDGRLARRRRGPGTGGRNTGRHQMKRLILALVAVSLLGGCGTLGVGGKKKKNVTPTVGERISVLSQERVARGRSGLAARPR